MYDEHTASLMREADALAARVKELEGGIREMICVKCRCVHCNRARALLGEQASGDGHNQGGE